MTYPQQEQEQYDDYFVANPALLFIETARQQIEQAAGGSGTWNAGAHYARLLAHSSYEPEVRALYERAGLNLHDDLATLTAAAMPESAVAQRRAAALVSGTRYAARPAEHADDHRPLCGAGRRVPAVDSD